MTLLRESGYILTVDGGASIALRGGWELSSQCRSGPNNGGLHQCHGTSTLIRGSGFHCVHCEMPLYEIWVGEYRTSWTSIEPHVIEEEPW